LRPWVEPEAADMPLYAFRCEECGEPFDVRASFAEKEAGLSPRCPSCSGDRVKQVMTAGLLIHAGPSASSPPACDPGAGCCPW
jgi:putative FmdB family regulatory protein